MNGHYYDNKKCRITIIIDVRRSSSSINGHIDQHAIFWFVARCTVLHFIYTLLSRAKLQPAADHYRTFHSNQLDV